MKAVSLNPKEWLRLSECGPDGHLMPPTLLHLIYNNLGSHPHQQTQTSYLVPDYDQLPSLQPHRSVSLSFQSHYT